ncbi:MAG: hypothetical protein SOZ52_05085 [Pyramidobacter sp.]|nr:hypothetical protein [Pyramidobacter sp.]
MLKTERDPNNRGEEIKKLRWFVGVPLGTNPLILLDFFIVLAIAWLVSWLALLALQFLFGGFLETSHLFGGAVVASYISLIFIALFLVICFLITRNHYAALYRFDSSRVLCDNIRAHPRALDGRLIHWKGYPIDPSFESIRNVERSVSWSDVTRIQPLHELMVVLLRGKRGVLMRVYCPDESTFQQALAFAQKHCAGNTK